MYKKINKTILKKIPKLPSHKKSQKSHVTLVFEPSVRTDSRELPAPRTRTDDAKSHFTSCIVRSFT